VFALFVRVQSAIKTHPKLLTTEVRGDMADPKLGHAVQQQAKAVAQLPGLHAYFSAKGEDV
jgi:hypothetical protein